MSRLFRGKNRGRAARHLSGKMGELGRVGSVEALESRRLLCAGGDELGSALGTYPAIMGPQSPSLPTSNVAAAAALTGGTTSLLSVPAYNSLPGAAASLYLDFDGDTTSSWGGYSPGTTPAFDTDGDPTTFSSAELSAIQRIWAGVAEKYSPFKINVTTVDTGNLTDLKTMKVVIGGNGAWSGGSYGGIAYVGGFANSQPNISFVFPQNLGNNPQYIAEASSHESGHGFGLQHQSTFSGTTKTNEYNPGDGKRAPIMGNSYSAPRGMWWLGSDTNNTTQDDLSVISSLTTNKFGYRPDDRGNSPAAATGLTVSGNNFSGSGVVETTADLDYFSFTTATGGAVTFGGAVSQYNPMLDLKLQIRDASNAVLASADTTSLGESFSANLAAGTYYVVVGSHGSYGDVGQYTVTGSVVPAAVTKNVSVATNFTGTREGAVSVPVNIDNAAGVQAFDLTLTYDTMLLDLSNADVTAGSLLPAGWTVTANVDDTTGTVTISGYSATAMTGSGGGTLANVLFHVPAAAPAGTSAVHVTGRINEGNVGMNATDGSVVVPLMVTINGVGATSAEGTQLSAAADVQYATGTLSYSWTVTKNGAAYANGSGTAFNFTPNDNGTYVVQLLAQDTDGHKGTDSRTVTVTNVAPSASIGGVPAGGAEGTAIGLTPLVSDPGSVDTFTYAWSVTKNGVAYASGNAATFSFTPNDNGTYVVNLSVTDRDGGVGTAAPQTIAVTNVAPTAAIVGAPASGPEGMKINLTGAVSDPGTLDTFTYAWGVTKNGAAYANGAGSAFNFTPDDNGTYVVNLSVTDKDGGVGTAAAQTINVTNVAPVATIVGAPAQSPEGTPIVLGGSAADPGAADAPVYAWSVTKDGASYASGSGASWTLTPDGAGSYVVTLNVTDKDGAVGTDSRTINVSPMTFRVMSVTPTVNGVDVTFNRAAQAGLLSLYDGSSSPGAADVTLVGEAVGAVRGSLVWDDATDTARFVKTDGMLAADRYTLALASRADGWVDVLGGMLDGNGDGTAGDNYSTSFTVEAAAARVVSIPSFARGPGQAVNLPATGAGLPVYVDEGSGITQASFDVVYDPSKLTISGAALGEAAPAGWAVSVDTSVAGRAHVVVSGTTPLGEGRVALARMTAAVPATATYRGAQGIVLTNVSLNGGSVAAAGAETTQVVEYVGDASGDGSYSALDAALIARVVVGLDSGFDGLAAYDPGIVGDVTGDGTLSSLDASVVAGEAAGLPEPTIPDGGLGTVPQPPTPPGAQVIAVHVGSGALVARPGGTIDVPVTIDAATGLMSVDLTLSFDPALVNIGAADVSLGGLTQGWTVVSNTASPGAVRLVLFNTVPMNAGAGSLVDLVLHVAANAPVEGSVPLDLGARLNEGRAVADVSQGAVTLDGVAPQVSAETFDALGTSPAVTVRFSEDVLGSAEAGGVTVVNLATGETLDAAKVKVAYDAATHVATVSFPGYPGGLPDGNYRLTLAPQAIIDAAGNALASAYAFDFFALAGDANHDRTVDFNDLVVLAQNYNATGKTFAEGDFNYDGNVDFNDLVILAQRYNTTLAAYGTPAGAAGATATASDSAMADWSRALAVASGEVISPTTVAGGQTTQADGVETRSGPPARGVKTKAVKRAVDVPVPPAVRRVFSSKRVRREILA